MNRRPALRELISVTVLVTIVLFLQIPFDSKWTQIGVTFGVFAMVVAGLEGLWGLAGQPSVGHNGFIAVGAYSVGILTTKSDFHPLLALAAAIVMSLVAATVLWPFVHRLEGTLFLIATLGFGLFVPAFAVTQASLTGGASGLFGIPSLEIRGWRMTEISTQYNIVWVLAGLTVLAIVRLRRSRIGLALRIINGQVAVAEACGIDAARERFKLFLYSAAIAGLAGGFYAYLLQIFSPDFFTFSLVVSLFTIEVVGGLGTGYGAIVGGVIVGLMNMYTSRAGEYTGIVYGVVFLLVIFFFSRGVVGQTQHLWHTWRRSNRPAEAALSFAGASLNGDDDLSDLVGPPAPLRAERVSKRFGGVLANDAISLVIAPGDITGLVGANGAGKSTFLDALTGVLTVDSGDVYLSDEWVTALHSHERSRRGIARTFQQPRYVPDMTVLENVAIGCHVIGHSGLITSIVSGRGQRDLYRMVKRARRTLHLLGMSHLESKTAGELSFGQIRLLELARALAMRPSILLLDEPLSGLGADEKAAIADLLRKLANLGLAIGLVEHDTDVVASLCDPVYVLDFGGVIARGPGSEIFMMDVVRGSYMGEDFAIVAGDSHA